MYADSEVHSDSYVSFFIRSQADVDRMATAIQQMSAVPQPSSMALQEAQSSMAGSGTFSCSISVDSTKYSISDDVLPWLMFVLVNNNPTTEYYVLKWHTPLEGFRSHFLKVYCNEEELPYEGIMAKRGNPDPASYDLLLPGSAVSGSVYLGEAYALSKPGIYRVELNTSLMDVIPNEGGDFKPHVIDDFKGQDLRCEPVVFEIVA